MKQYHLKPNSYWRKGNTPRKFVDSCSHSGSCDADVEKYFKYFYATDEDIQYLKHRLLAYGMYERDIIFGWDTKTVISYTIWLMAGEIRENGDCWI